MQGPSDKLIIGVVGSHLAVAEFVPAGDEKRIDAIRLEDGFSLGQ